MIILFIIIGILITVLIFITKEFVIPKIKPRLKLYMMSRKNKKMQKEYINKMKKLEIK